jgi:phosphohistidine phosphatase
MKLYLVQHGQAKSKEEDPQRPLSEKGMADAGKTAFFASRQAKITVSRIMHSGKTRAGQTAEIMAGFLNPPDGVKEAQGLAPLDEPSIMAAQLEKMNDDCMLVGHLPHMERLAAYLLCHDPEKKVVDFSMAGIVCLTRDESAVWSVSWMVIPEIVSQ